MVGIDTIGPLNLIGGGTSGTKRNFLGGGCSGAKPGPMARSGYRDLRVRS